MTGRYHIGAFGKLTGHSVHTIRWYEAEGLLPGVERDSGGRRVYLEGHVELLRFLERLRSTGMPVAEVRKYSQLAYQGWRTLGERQALLRAHRASVEARISDAQNALKLIDAKLAYYAEWQRNKKRPAKPPAILVGRVDAAAKRKSAAPRRDPR